MDHLDDATLSLVLWTTDIEGLANFLVSVTGAEELGRHPGFADLKLGAVTISLHADEAGMNHPWFDALGREGAARGIGAELRVRVADVPAAFANARALGGVGVQPPYDSGDVRECQVLAPDGFLLSLWQPVPTGAAPLAPPVTSRREVLGGIARPVIRRRF